MKSMVIKNARAIMPIQKAETVSLLIKDEKIIEISYGDKNFQADETPDLSNATLYAGFIDIHNHGAVGVDVNGANANDLREVSKFLAGRGVPVWLPTLVPDSDENYGKIIEAIDELMKTQANEPIAQILGVHYEGVFANEKMCGALRPQFFKTFKNGDEIESLQHLKNGVHLTTLAPEVENVIELVKELRKQSWIVSIGRTKVELKILEKRFETGAKHLTHFCYCHIFEMSRTIFALQLIVFEL